MEQPREPIFYPIETSFPFYGDDSTYKTLQSIECTLKRIENILDNCSKKNQFDVSGENPLS